MQVSGAFGIAELGGDLAAVQALQFQALFQFGAHRVELEQGLELQGLNSSQIAAQLGYADSPAYLHARKRWREPKQP
jgi:hypothetical protein